MRRRFACGAAVAAAASVFALAPTASAAVHVRRILRGLASPVYVTTPPRDSRLFVVEKCGVIRIDRAGRLLRRPFLDISRRVSCSGEEGLLSMAFDPGFRTNRLVYVDYINRTGDTRVARFVVERRTRTSPTPPAAASWSR
jgi:glucose/arabinose dehydrogenase